MAVGPATKHNTEDLHYEGNMECHLPFSKTSNHTVVIQDVCWRNGNDRLVLDTEYIMESLAGTAMKVKTIGNDQYTASLAMNCCQSV